MYRVTARFSANGPATAANVNARRVRSTPIETVLSAPTGRQLWIAGLPTAPGRNLNLTLRTALEGDLSATVQALTSLDGAFAVFVWDPTLRKLAIVTDFLGLQPLYMRRTAGNIAFAGTIGELGEGCGPDPAGWGAFVGFGHFIGDHTSVAGVTRVPPATILEYEPDTDRLSMRTYWRWPDVRPDMTEPDTGELLDLLAASIDAYREYGSEGTLLLSGGYESRLLAALLVRAGARPSALTLRNPY
jgi:asparagine synthetase B (glutamine-hydrolysing)